MDASFRPGGAPETAEDDSTNSAIWSSWPWVTARDPGSGRGPRARPLLSHRKINHRPVATDDDAAM
jgi:hypothetical protein